MITGNNIQHKGVSPTLIGQSGISLIELLVSMMIGIFLLGGLATNLISTTKSDKSRQAVSELDSNAQFAMDIIRQAVSHAGYPSTRNVYLDKAFYTKEDGNLSNPDCKGGKLKRDIPGQTPTSTKWTRDDSRSDVLTVVALADNPCVKGKASCSAIANANPQALVYIDCAAGGIDRNERTVSCSTDADVGMSPPLNAKIFNTFRLDVQNRTLICEGNRGGKVVLVDGVYAMQFLYGVRTSNGDTSYKNADSIESSNQWGLVNSVQVALLMESSDENVFDTKNSKTKYTLLDKIITIPDYQLRRLYRVYSMTINLANMK